MVRSRAASLFALSGLIAACGGSSGAARGRQLYAEHGCAVCHGAQGHGDGPSVKRLDARPRDFADRNNYKNGADAERIAATIRGGVGSMPPFRDLSEEEARDIAAWIVTLQRPAGAAGRPTGQ